MLNSSTRFQGICGDRATPPKPLHDAPPPPPDSQAPPPRNSGLCSVFEPRAFWSSPGPRGKGLWNGGQGESTVGGGGSVAALPHRHEPPYTSLKGSPVVTGGSGQPLPWAAVHHWPTGLATRWKQTATAPQELKEAGTTHGSLWPGAGHQALAKVATAQAAGSGVPPWQGLKGGHCQAPERAIKHLQACLSLSRPQKARARGPSRSNVPHSHPHRQAGRP